MAQFDWQYPKLVRNYPAVTKHHERLLRIHRNACY